MGPDFVGWTVVGVQQSRWQVAITMRSPSGESEVTMIASADRFYTEGDGIWWNTEAETREWQG